MARLCHRCEGLLSPMGLCIACLERSEAEVDKQREKK